MRVGDVVSKSFIPVKENPVIGIVVEIHDWKINEGDYPEETTSFRKDWISNLGRRIDVLWSNGEFTKSLAEGSLVVLKTA